MKMQKSKRQILHFDSLASTQDEARNQLQLLVQGGESDDNTDDADETNKNNNNDDNNNNNNNYIAITTSLQTNGRGTSGRKWISEKGNTFITIAVPSTDLLSGSGNVPITLLPLQVGIIIATRINEIINTNTNTNSHASASTSTSTSDAGDAKVNVKWPNDVLVNGKKIAGVLIESEQVTMRGGTGKGTGVNVVNYFLIGIGINYKFAPKIDQEVDSPERGRESTCICDFLIPSDAVDDNGDDDEHDHNIYQKEKEKEEENSVIVQKAKDLGVTIANDVWDWVEMQSNWDGAAEAVVRNFEHWAEFGQELVLRDTPDNEIVIPVSIEKDGRLRVKNKFGVERLLCADYLL